MNRQISPAAILILEDEHLIAQSIEAQLISMGYKVIGSARTGEEAVRQAAELRPDIILMDIQLGEGIDGVQAADLIRQKQHVPIVFLTAHSDDATLQRAKVTEPYGYLLKPFEEADLKIAIEIGLYKERANRRGKGREQWLSAVLENIGDGVVATDTKWRVCFINALAERLTGWSRAEAVGRDVNEVVKIYREHSWQSGPRSAHNALIRGKVVPRTCNSILISRDGSKHQVEESTAPIRDLNGADTGAVFVFRDLSEPKRLEEKHRRAHKLEEMSRVAGAIIMDYTNIFTAVTGYAELLRLNNDSANERQAYLDEILRFCEWSARLSKLILAFSRKRFFDPQVLNLNNSVSEIGATVRQFLGEKIHFVINESPDLVHVLASPSHIEVIILNLVFNAQEAMPTGGRLELSTANAVLDEQIDREYSEVVPGRYAMLSVSDTGTGMTPEVMDRIFEPFFTTKNLNFNRGFGLASLYGFVKQSGGHIDVSSTVGVGSTFRVYLPMYDGPLPTPSADIKAASSHWTETILLVESNERIRQCTKVKLQQHGYKVLEASNAEDCLAMNRDYEGTIHLLLTELTLMQMNGRQLAKLVAESRPGVNVLFMSWYIEETLVHADEESSGIEFLYMPFTLNTLLTKIRNVLDRP